MEEHIRGRFLVFNGDVLTDLDLTDLIAFHEEKKAKATLYLTHVEDPTAYGLVPLDDDGRILEFLEKPSPDQVTTDLINAGTYVLEPELLDRVPAGDRYSFERQLFPGMLEDGLPMFGFPSDAYWMDIVPPAKHLQAHCVILDRKLLFDFEGREIRPSVWVADGCDISAEATVKGPAILGPGCQVAAYAVIEGNCVLGPGCRIGEGARLEAAVLHEGCTVGAGSILNCCVLSADVTVGERVNISGEAVLGGGVVIEDENDLRHGIRIWPGAKIPAATLHF